MNFIPTEGKSIDLVENSKGEKFLVCKFIDTEGTHIRIFNFVVESGMIGTEVLREKIIVDVNKEPTDDRSSGDEFEDEKMNQTIGQI